MHDTQIRKPNYNPYVDHNYCSYCGWVPKNVPEDYRCYKCGRMIRVESRTKSKGKKDIRKRYEGGG